MKLQVGDRLIIKDKSTHIKAPYPNIDNKKIVRIANGYFYYDSGGCDQIKNESWILEYYNIITGKTALDYILESL